MPNLLDRISTWPGFGAKRSEDMGVMSLSGITDGSFYDMLVNALDGVSSGSGIDGLPKITMENAGTNGALYLSMALTAGTLGGLPMQLFGDDEGKVSDERSDIFTRFPNPDETPQEFWETTLAHRSLAGDLFIHCSERHPMTRRVTEMNWIHPMRMQVGRDPRTKRKVYVLDGDQEHPMFTANEFEGEIIHVRNLMWGRKNAGLRGFGLIDLAKNELKLDKAELQHVLVYLEKGGTPRLIITSDAEIADDQAEKIVRRWMKVNGGINNTGKPAVVGSGGKVQAVSGTPAEVQSIAARTAQIKAIARFTGVPPFMLMDSTGSTTWGTGLGEIGQGFVTYTLNRMATPVQQALLRILPRNEYVRWNFNALVRGNLLQRMQAYQIRRLIGMSSVDELRALEEELPIDPADMWKYQLPLNSNVAATPAPAAEGSGGDSSDLQAQIDDLKKQLAATEEGA